MYYIQEIDKPNKLWKMLNKIKLKDNKIILPIKDEKISSRQAQKLAFKTKKLLEKANCNKLVLSHVIKKQEQYQNYLDTYGFQIADGKWLFEILSQEILEYITEKKKLKKEEISVSILVNQLSEITLQNIKKIAREYKRVNVITNHIAKLKKIEEEMLEKEGVMITVTNNKRKSLLKSDMILNIDFPSELINQYQIKENAFIINIQGNVKIKKKRFSGICINDYEISVKEIEENGKEIFSMKDIYEGEFYRRQPFEEIKKKLKKDKVKIEWLKGNKEMI